MVLTEPVVVLIDERYPEQGVVIGTLCIQTDTTISIPINDLGYSEEWTELIDALLQGSRASLAIHYGPTIVTLLVVADYLLLIADQEYGVEAPILVHYRLPTPLAEVVLRALRAACS